MNESKLSMLRQWRNERMKIADECEKRGDHAGAKRNRKVADLYDNLIKTN